MDRKDYDKLRYRNDPERRAACKERARRWRTSPAGIAWAQRVIERTRAKDRERSKRSKPRRMAYYRKNKEIIAAKAKAFRAANPALCQEWQHKHEVKRRAKRYQYNKQYRLNNPEKLRLLSWPLKMAYKARRKTLEQAAPEELKAIAKFIRATLRLSLIICTYCGSTTDKPHFDHRIPLARGGKHELSNLCVACGTCNCSKGDKTPEEFAEYRKEAKHLWQAV